jgi:hypothetical protein
MGFKHFDIPHTVFTGKISHLQRCHYSAMVIPWPSARSLFQWAAIYFIVENLVHWIRILYSTKVRLCLWKACCDETLGEGGSARPVKRYLACQLDIMDDQLEMDSGLP